MAAELVELGERGARNALLQIPELVTPLRDNSERVFNESEYNQETADGWEVGPERLRINFDIILDLCCIIAELFDGVFWVCGPVARGGT